MAESFPPKLIDMAIEALCELAEEAEDRPYNRSRQLRFVLAFLHSRAPGNGEAYAKFWRYATRPRWNQISGGVERKRKEGMGLALERICRLNGRDVATFRERYRQQEDVWFRKHFPDTPIPRPNARRELSSGRVYQPPMPPSAMEVEQAERKAVRAASFARKR